MLIWSLGVEVLERKPPSPKTHKKCLSQYNPWVLFDIMTPRKDCLYLSGVFSSSFTSNLDFKYGEQLATFNEREKLSTFY